MKELTPVNSIFRKSSVLPVILENNNPEISDCVVEYEQIPINTVFARRGLQSVGIDGLHLAPGIGLFCSKSRDSGIHLSWFLVDARHVLLLRGN